MPAKSRRRGPSCRGPPCSLVPRATVPCRPSTRRGARGGSSRCSTRRPPLRARIGGTAGRADHPRQPARRRPRMGRARASGRGPDRTRHDRRRGGFSCPWRPLRPNRGAWTSAFCHDQPGAVGPRDYRGSGQPRQRAPHRGCRRRGNGGRRLGLSPRSAAGRWSLVLLPADAGRRQTGRDGPRCGRWRRAAGHSSGGHRDVAVEDPGAALGAVGPAGGRATSAGRCGAGALVRHRRAAQVRTTRQAAANSRRTGSRLPPSTGAVAVSGMQG